MRTFADFLCEIRMDVAGEGDDHSIHVTGKSGDHHFRVTAIHQGVEGEYDILASVNHTMYTDKMKGEPHHVRARAALGISRAVDHFIRHVKPRAITFSPTDIDKGEYERKASHYHTFAQQIAKRHGGEFSSDGIESRIDFRR